MPFPRTVLLTRFSPDIRYAGGEAVRKVVGQFPPGCVRWCALRRSKAENDPHLPANKGFTFHSLHWRLRDTVLDYLYVNELQAANVARSIWEWIRPFEPQVLWVLPELAAVNVAWHLHRISGLPLHATIHDAHEFAGHICVPRLYLPIYLQNVRRLFAQTASFDCISKELLDHVRAEQGIDAGIPGIVVPPSVDPGIVVGPQCRPVWPNEVRRIGLCGSLRSSREQWESFLRLLGSLPFTFEIVSYCSDAAVRDARPPNNVSVHQRAYASSEDEVVRAFSGGRVDTCYMSLWREPEKSLFGRTSLSSKLVTYSAAGVPIIVDAAPDAVAWRLVREYGAGVLCNGNTTSDRQALERLFGDATVWGQMAEGAYNLCVKEFNLEKNVGRLKELLEQTALGQTAG